MQQGPPTRLCAYGNTAVALKPSRSLREMSIDGLLAQCTFLIGYMNSVSSNPLD